MCTVAELTVAEELTALREIASGRGWVLKELDALNFQLGLGAGDGSWFYLLVNCENYPAQPAAWDWCDAEGRRTDRLADKPQGSGFLHASGVVCAPWNRLAYKAVDSRGPHPDWAIGDWQNNPHTGGCRTLAHAALRLCVELNGPHFSRKRLGN
jgi:hypothetical protein